MASQHKQKQLCHETSVLPNASRSGVICLSNTCKTFCHPHFRHSIQCPETPMHELFLLGPSGNQTCIYYSVQVCTTSILFSIRWDIHQIYCTDRVVVVLHFRFACCPRYLFDINTVFACDWIRDDFCYGWHCHWFRAPENSTTMRAYVCVLNECWLCHWIPLSIHAHAEPHYGFTPAMTMTFALLFAIFGIPLLIKCKLIIHGR